MSNEKDDAVPPAPMLRSVRFVAERHDWTIPFIYHLIRTNQVKAYRQGEKITVVDVKSADDYATSRPLDLTEHKPIAAIQARAAKRAKAKAKPHARSTKRKRGAAAEQAAT
jgi:hypothetical protein